MTIWQYKSRQRSGGRELLTRPEALGKPDRQAGQEKGKKYADRISPAGMAFQPQAEGNAN